MLVLKVVLTPTLIAAATLFGRRFGQSVAGWLIAFPLTSAPVSVFLALEQGHAFAAAAAVGSAAGVLAQSAFPLGYAYARRRGWVAAVLAGTVAFTAVGLALRAIDAPLALFALADVVVLLAVLRALPRVASAGAARSVAPWWDLGARAVVATALVVGLTAVAPLLGPFASGVVAGFPVYGTVLAVFAHRALGPDAGAEVLRGMTAGLFGFAAFFVVVAVALLPLGLVATYGLATLAVLAIQSLSLSLLRRSQRASGQ